MQPFARFPTCSQQRSAHLRHFNPSPTPPHLLPASALFPCANNGSRRGFCFRFDILRGMGVMWSEATFVDWTNEEEKVEYPWREWGHAEEEPEAEDISVAAELSVKDADPLV